MLLLLIAAINVFSDNNACTFYDFLFYISFHFIKANIVKYSSILW